MSKEYLQELIDKTLQVVDEAVLDLSPAKNPKIEGFTSENDGHGLPGRVYSFLGLDSVNRYVHVYIDNEKKDLTMGVEVNAWFDNAGVRSYTNKLVGILPVSEAVEPIKNVMGTAFEVVLGLGISDLSKSVTLPLR